MVAGTITAGGPPVPVTISNPGDTAELAFSGVSGQRVFAAFTDNTFLGGTRGAFLKPDGTPLSGPQYLDAGYPYLDTVVLPVDGTYKIWIDPNGHTGSITVTLYDVPPDPGPVVVPSRAGDSVTVSATVPGQNLSPTFEGRAGQRVFIHFTGNSIGGDTRASLRLGVNEVVWPFYPDAGNPFIDAVTLPSDGTYVIFVDPHGADTGSITITAYDVPPDPAPVVMPSRAGDSVTLSTTVPGQNLSPTFQGRAGQRVSVNFTGNSTGGDTRASLRLGANEVVWPFYLGAGYPFMDTATLPSDGTYVIFVDPHGVDTGSITITAYDVPPDPAPSLPAASPVTLSVATPGQNMAPTFQGSAGQHVHVDFTNDTIASTKASLRFGTDEVVWPFYIDAGFPFMDATLPSTGTYTVFVDPQGASTGGVTVTLDGGSGGGAGAAGQSFGPNVCRTGRGIHARSATGCLNDPVNSLTGAYTASVTDVSLPGTGIPFELTRSYTSADQSQGRLGIGWTDSYSAALVVQGNGDVVLHGEDGQQVGYARQPDGSFVGAAGALSTLSSVGGGYRLIRPDQVTYSFDAQGRLESIKDRDDQGPALAYDGSGRLATITDSVGRQIALTYDGAGFLNKVELPDGRSVSYGYTGSLLTSVVDVTGGTTTYSYDSEQRLTRAVDPIGNAVVENTYGQDGRVSRQVDALGEQTTFAWDSSAQTETVTDARGKVWKDVYSDSRLIERIDPLGNTTRFGYDGSLDVTSVASPDGSTTAMTYDGRGNLLEVVAPASLGARKTFTYDSSNDVVSVTDARGKQTVYGYDSAGNLTQIVQAGATVERRTYNASGQVLTATDGRGSTTAYSYDSLGNLSSISDPLGNTTRYAYDAAGRLVSVLDALGGKTTYTYDAAGRPLTATGPLGDRTTYTYDAAGDRTSVTDSNNHKTTFEYDAAHRLVSVTAPDGGIVSYAYDAAGNRTGITDANHHTTTLAYDWAGRLAATTTPNGETTTYGYDADGNPVATTDPLGNVTTRTYDAAGRLTSETDPLGSTTAYTYDAVGNTAAVTDPNKHRTAYTYDAAGRVLSETAPDGGVTSYTYDANGNQLTRTDEDGHTTAFAYDAGNRLVAVTSPKGEKSTYGYDANGNRVRAVDPRGFSTVYGYDAAGRLLTVTDPVGSKTTYSYDALGNRIGTIDANGHRTAFGYDSANRLVSVTAADGGVTSYTYDKAGNLQTRTDANGRSTTYAYDVNDRRLSVVSPLGRKRTYAYDEAGRLVSFVDANGNATPTAGDGTTRYGYDRAGRLASIDYSDATPDVQLGYDPAGNRTSMADGAGTQTYTYDPADRVTRVTRAGESFSYGYDAAGNPIRRGYPDGSVATYTYDEDSRLASASSGGLTTTYAYDAAGELVRTTLPPGNGFVETRTYDGAGRLTEIQAARGNSVLARLSYALDPVGNPTLVTRTGALSGTTAYSYDAVDRLTSACFKASCPKANDPFVRWTYDRVGNRLSETRSAGTTTSAYDAADELTSAGKTAYSYDQNGNELTAGARTFRYDLANRLVSTTAGGVTTTYAYDGDGNRLQASTGALASQKTSYAWDGNGPLPQLALERDGAGSLLRRYLYGQQRISSTTPAGTYYYHHDSLGSVVHMTSSTGAKEWTVSYEPFGLIRTETKDDPKAPANPMKFAGELADPTGLHYLRARQYDPGLGRFLEVDPLEAAAGAPLASTYIYAGDRPTVSTDPSGMGPVRGASLATSAAATAASPVDAYAWLWALPSPAYLRRKIVAAALLGWRKRDAIHYTQSALRWQGIGERIYPPRVPSYADCSSFATWTYFVAGAADPNGHGYDASQAWTGTLGTHGTSLGTSRAQQLTHVQPGDLVFYGQGLPWKHVAIYVGGGLVVSHGTEAGPLRLPIDYRPDRGDVRSYF